ncbi:MAG: Gfo/Idh/MocA family oxidoreductase, partial [Myxococcales bacterium]|nr:Gfo/Idh/MocA family oxidoreductase [Myxococcales bacterium]
MREMLAATAATAAPWSLAAGCSNSDSSAPGSRSDAIRLAVIGAGGFGTDHVERLAGRADVELRYVCDADMARAEARADEAEALSGHRPATVQDMRRVLDDPQVDAVTMATPHHWHAVGGVWAMQAGKDLYLEKPVSHAFDEGLVLIGAAQALGRVCQAGLHRRANPSLSAGAAHVREGGIGSVRLASCLTWLERSPIFAADGNPVPDTVDLDLWSGPAPDAVPDREKFHYHWHWFWETGNGGLGNNGVHRIDLVRWALGLSGMPDWTLSYGARAGEPDAGETPNTQISIQQFDQTTVVQDVRGLPSPDHDHCNNGVVLEGEDGFVVFCKKQASLFDRDGAKVMDFPGEQGESFDSFIAAVQSQDAEQVACSIEEGHLSSALCHLSNLSYQLGEDVDDGAIDQRLGELGAHESVHEVLAATRAPLD